MSKKALLFSVQNFDNPVKPQLRGCINDTKIWKNALSELMLGTDDSIEIHHDMERDDAFDLLKKFITELKDGDTGIIFFSGHAVNIRLNDVGVEIEGLLFKDNNSIFEFQVLAELENLKKEAKLIIIIDSCYSRGFAEYISLDLQKDTIQASIVDGRATLEFKQRNHSRNLLVSVNADIINRDLSRVPESILIPSKLLKSKEKTEEISQEIKTCIEAYGYKSKLFTYAGKMMIYKEEPKTEMASRGQVDTNIPDEIIAPSTPPLTVNHYENITLIAAEKRVSQKAHERHFKKNGGYAAGHYGVFSYYATKAILANLEISYKKLKKQVNKSIKNNETNKDIKKQRMEYDSGNNDWKRKLFT
ncbi:caspase family protein [uncultured Kordia sp.]|uniref:caspase family protein n=1 Tax=uncultured Kordia sp. TaxID=507699 RepID=UPI002635B517|nr:caspase family protein [uncultured Kordia sp.]